ncbi:MAG: hypothetical protein WKG06_01915 [Segetibacter sp.]
MKSGKKEEADAEKEILKKYTTEIPFWEAEVNRLENEIKSKLF